MTSWFSNLPVLPDEIAATGERKRAEASGRTAIRYLALIGAIKQSGQFILPDAVIPAATD